MAKIPSSLRLDPDVREKIRAEEIFRAEVRASLAEKKSPARRVWDAANSAFVLFFLGSVVLTFGSFVYKKWERETAAAHERRRFYAHAFNELNLRAYTAQQALPKGEIDGAKPLMADRYLLLVPGTQDTFFAPLFPEFVGRNAVSILKDLQEDCSAFTCPKVKEALNQIQVVRDIGMRWNDKDYPRQRELVVVQHALNALRAAVEYRPVEPNAEISRPAQH